MLSYLQSTCKFCFAQNLRQSQKLTTFERRTRRISINHAHLTIIFATANHIPELLKLASKTPQVKMVVTMDEITPEQKKILAAWGDTVGIQVKELKECE